MQIGTSNLDASIARARSEGTEIMKTRFVLFAFACLLMAVPATAQVNYGINGNVAYVGRSLGASGNIVIASTYNGYPVTSIVSSPAGAFEGCSGLTSVTIPSSVTN